MHTINFPNELSNNSISVIDQSLELHNHLCGMSLLYVYNGLPERRQFRDNFFLCEIWESNYVIHRWQKNKQPGMCPTKILHAAVDLICFFFWSEDP